MNYNEMIEMHNNRRVDANIHSELREAIWDSTKYLIEEIESTDDSSKIDSVLNSRYLYYDFNTESLKYENGTDFPQSKPEDSSSLSPMILKQLLKNRYSVSLDSIRISLDYRAIVLVCDINSTREYKESLNGYLALLWPERKLDDGTSIVIL